MPITERGGCIDNVSKAVLVIRKSNGKGTWNITEQWGLRSADLGLAHVVQDVQSILPVAQLCIGAEQGDVAHDVWLEACRIHVIKHLLYLHMHRHMLMHPQTPGSPSAGTTICMQHDGLSLPSVAGETASCVNDGW